MASTMRGFRSGSRYIDCQALVVPTATRRMAPHPNPLPAGGERGPIRHCRAIRAQMMRRLSRGSLSPHRRGEGWGEGPYAWLRQWQTCLTCSYEQTGFQFLSNASNSSISPSIIDRPLLQNDGSVASRPKGFRSSEWCLVPPAFRSSKYLSWKPFSAFW